MKKLTAFDVFCGCGGTTQGLREAGFRVVGGIEIDPLAAATYRANHKHVKIWETDIRELNPKSILAELNMQSGELDLLVGCPPCQSFSAMKRLNGGKVVRDKKSKDLVLEFLRFVESVNPKVVLIENVPGLASDYRFSEVRRRLRSLGFVGEPVIRNAADFGVPQRRRRMVFVASRVGNIQHSEILPASRHVVRDAIGHLPNPDQSDDPLHSCLENRSQRIMEMISLIPKDGGSRSALGKRFRLECHVKTNGFKDVYGRMAWDEVAPTITSGCVNPSKGRFLHPEQDRAITLREAALLQSFPKDYRFSLERGKFAVALMIGNAFPPKFVEAHAIQIHQYLRNLNAG